MGLIFRIKGEIREPDYYEMSDEELSNYGLKKEEAIPFGMLHGLKFKVINNNTLIKTPAPSLIQKYLNLKRDTFTGTFYHSRGGSTYFLRRAFRGKNSTVYVVIGGSHTGAHIVKMEKSEIEKYDKGKTERENISPSTPF